MVDISGEDLLDARASLGVSGLDDILGGGVTKDRVYLVEGTPGTGKTTLSLQFLLEGARRGETGLYITLSETKIELNAATHGWSLDKISLFELVTETGLDPESEQSILHPSEVELGETTREVMKQVTRFARPGWYSTAFPKCVCSRKIRFGIAVRYWH